ncbi:hypothetical protein JCM19000A_27820 [Silvimonas sp. JCM 19000]
MKTTHKIAALALGLSLGAAAQAQTLTFSDLTVTGQPQLWHGFDIPSDTATLDASASLVPQPYGTKALVGSAQDIVVLHALTPFFFSGANASPAAVTNYGLAMAPAIRFVGYLDGVQVAAQSFSLFHNYADGSADLNYYWYDVSSSFASQKIDALAIFPDGNYWSQGGLWSIDAINISPVPEPETWALMGLGLVGLIAGRRKAVTA